MYCVEALLTIEVNVMCFALQVECRNTAGNGHILGDINHFFGDAFSAVRRWNIYTTNPEFIFRVVFIFLDFQFQCSNLFAIVMRDQAKWDISIQGFDFNLFTYHLFRNAGHLRGPLIEIPANYRRYIMRMIRKQ